MSLPNNPKNLQMFAIIEKSTSTIRKYVALGGDLTIGLRRLVTLDGPWEDENYRAVPLEVVDPLFDNPPMQQRSGPVTTILPDKVTRVWTVRSKNRQELIDAEIERVDGALKRQFRGLEVFFHEVDNRLRVLERKDARSLEEYMMELRRQL